MPAETGKPGTVGGRGKAVPRATLRDGRQLAFAEYGDPAGWPVFFFHGWPGSRLDFAPNDDRLSVHARA